MAICQLMVGHETRSHGHETFAAQALAHGKRHSWTAVAASASPEELEAAAVEDSNPIEWAAAGRRRARRRVRQAGDPSMLPGFVASLFSQVGTLAYIFPPRAVAAVALATSSFESLTPVLVQHGRVGRAAFLAAKGRRRD